VEPLSASILTYNSERTLEFCLESVRFVDEIVILDSLSTDATLDIARKFGCRVHQQAFAGYGRQREDGWNLARTDWVLVLDSDEALSPGLAEEIRAIREDGPRADGYDMPRQEQLYWTMASARMHLTRFLRLFDRRRARMSDKPVHAAPIVEGRIGHLRHPIRHYSKGDVHGRVHTANEYSTDLVRHGLVRGRGRNPLWMAAYPPVYFLRSYLLHRHFLNGWAGFIAAATSAFYVFLKCAKVYEATQVARHGNRLLPDPVPFPQREKGRRPA
jgi:glycosyltransferase involved in cell wall biosynthesis